MKITPLEIKDVLLIEPQVMGDQRGFFFESWNKKKFELNGLNLTFVQDNVSRSARGVLRGLHFQNPNPQGKFISVLEGEVFDVAVDLRKNSVSFGKWVARILSGANHHQLYVPPGFAHGFQVTSESALFVYKCTDFYSPENEQCLLWNDPKLRIPWPIEIPLLSSKDAKGISLEGFATEKLFV